MDIYGMITTVAVGVSLAGAMWFIALNHRHTTWRTSAWGRHVMRFSYWYVAILLLTLARAVFGDYPGRKLLVTIFFSLLSVEWVYRAYWVWRGIRSRKGIDHEVHP